MPSGSRGEAACWPFAHPGRSEVAGRPEVNQGGRYPASVPRPPWPPEPPRRASSLQHAPGGCRRHALSMSRREFSSPVSQTFLPEIPLFRVMALPRAEFLKLKEQTIAPCPRTHTVLPGVLQPLWGGSREHLLLPSR